MKNPYHALLMLIPVIASSFATPCWNPSVAI